MTIDTQLQDIITTWIQAEENFRAGHRAESLVTQIRCALGYSRFANEQKANVENEHQKQDQDLFLNNETALHSTTHSDDLELSKLWLTPSPIGKKIYWCDLLLQLIPYLDNTIKTNVIDEVMQNPVCNYLELSKCLSPHLNTSQITNLFNRAINNESPYSRQYILSHIAFYLPPDLLKQGWLSLQNHAYFEGLPSGIGELASCLPAEEADEALEILLSLKSERRRAEALTKVLSRISTDELDIVVENVLSMEDKSIIYTQISLLSEIIPLLSDEKFLSLYTYLSESWELRYFLELLEPFAKRVPTITLSPFIAQVDILKDGTDAFWRVVGLWMSRIEQPNEEVLWKKIWQLTHENLIHEERAWAFICILKLLEGNLRNDILLKILEDIRFIPSWEKENFLISLSDVIRGEEFALLLQTISNLRTPDDQLRVIAFMIYKLPNRFLPEALALARTHDDLWVGPECEN